MIEGLYKVQFQTPLGMGFGVINLENGKANGGDSAIAYTGSYTVDAGTFSSTIQVNRHSDGLPSVLGTDNASLQIRGSVDGNIIIGEGTTPHAAGVKLSIQLSLLKAA
ncbi:MAG: GrlR family regulatory protein [Pseudomonadota bacterium]